MRQRLEAPADFVVHQGSSAPAQPLDGHIVDVALIFEQTHLPAEWLQKTRQLGQTWCSDRLNRVESFKLAAFDARPDEAKALQSGIVQAPIGHKLPATSSRAVDYALHATDGKPVTENTNTSFVALTADNTAEFLHLKEALIGRLRQTVRSAGKLTSSENVRVRTFALARSEATDFVNLRPKRMPRASAYQGE